MVIQQEYWAQTEYMKPEENPYTMDPLWSLPPTAKKHEVAVVVRVGGRVSNLSSTDSKLSRTRGQSSVLNIRLQ